FSPDTPDDRASSVPAISGAWPGVMMTVRVEGAPGSAGRTESASAARLAHVSVVFSVPQSRTMRRWRGDDMPSQALPPRPSLDQLRRRAKELRDAARSGDPAALARITACTPAARSGTVTLAAAQLTIAREHGYPSWPQLVAEVQARTAELGQRVEEFLVASIRDWTGRAVRMLARDPWMAGYDVRAAVVLGDADRVREMLAREPGLATRTDEKTGWTALHAACAAQW